MIHVDNALWLLMEKDPQPEPLRRGDPHAPGPLQ